MKLLFYEKLFQKEKNKYCYGFMPSNFQVICVSMVGKNCWSTASTETPTALVSVPHLDLFWYRLNGMGAQKKAPKKVIVSLIPYI